MTFIVAIVEYIDEVDCDTAPLVVDGTAVDLIKSLVKASLAVLTTTEVTTSV